MSLLSVRRLSPLVAFAMLASISSCDYNSSAYSRLGVTAAGDGSLMAIYVACNHEKIESLTLYELDSDQVAPDPGDKVVWVAPQDQLPALATGLVISRATGPDVPITLNAKKDYLFQVKGNFGDAESEPFRQKDLSTEVVLADEARVPAAEFRSRAENSC